MRRIHKTCNLSTVYKAWQDGIEASGQPHPPYRSSNDDYYWDVAMNLYHCQGGLCAYTEMLLCSPELYQANRWQNGRYAESAEGNPNVKGQLEHFYKELKQNRGWLWDNFFMVDSDVNTKVKKSHVVDPILKPDAADYNEFEKLEYDMSKHVFIPNSGLPEAVRERINEMILILGINYDPIRELRRIYFSRILKMIEFKIETWDSINPEMFPTAYAMMRMTNTEGG